MRNIAIAIVAAGVLGVCEKPAPDPELRKADLTGKWRRSDPHDTTDFVEVQLRADGTYLLDTGIRCHREPCRSSEGGNWTLDSARRLTIGAHTYDADLKLTPRKMLRLRRHDDREGDRDATFESIPR